MAPTDVSVIWDDQGATCLRVKIWHFSSYGWGMRTYKDSYSKVRQPWSNTVQVYNATKYPMFLVLLPVAALTHEGRSGARELSALNVTARVEGERNIDRTLPPWSWLLSTATLASGGRYSFPPPDGQGRLIVCTLPDRDLKVTSGSPSPPVAQQSSPLTQNVPPPGQQPRSSPSSSSHNGSNTSDQSDYQQLSDGTEQLLYWDTLGVCTGERVTMLENRIDLGHNGERRVDKRIDNLMSEALRMAGVAWV